MAKISIIQMLLNPKLVNFLRQIFLQGYRLASVALEMWLLSSLDTIATVQISTVKFC